MKSGWTHGPPRSHDQKPDANRSRSSSPDDSAEEPRRRSSSDATPRQTPATTRFLSSTSAGDQDTNRNVLPSSNLPSDVFNSSKRLGFFADKLSSSLAGAGHSANAKLSLGPSHLLHPHNHPRVESSLTPSSATPSPSSMATSPSMSNLSKSHTSPSKVGHWRESHSKFGHDISIFLS